jgi:hypothetical protein
MRRMVPSSVRARLSLPLAGIVERALDEQAELGRALAGVIERGARSGATDEQIALALAIVAAISPPIGNGRRAAVAPAGLLGTPTQRYETGQSSRSDPESGPADDGDDET